MIHPRLIENVNRKDRKRNLCLLNYRLFGQHELHVLMMLQAPCLAQQFFHDGWKGKIAEGSSRLP